jgi:hypothetical protein
VAAVKTYLMQNLIALDQQLNALLGGMADETLSARAHRMREKKQKYWGWTANTIDFIFFWEKDHCFMAYQYEIRRRQLPEAYRDYP